MTELSGSDSYRYQAYVSYSHKDEKWATWLHKKLEAYRVPRHLVGRKTSSGVIPRRIAPVFRDRDDLPTSNDLSTSVNEALRRSANLIVICSPAATQSRWVNEEILAFKRLGRSARIFCLIVEGDPGESFPEALCLHHDADGELTYKPAEPIAADARSGKDGKSDALLKLVAGIIGVGFDALKQRDLHRRHHRMVAVTATALSVMVLTLGLAIRATIAEREALESRAQAESQISFMLGDLRDRLEPVGKLDSLDAVGDRAIEYFESIEEDSLTPETLLIRSRAMRQIGEVRMAQGNLDAAMDAFQRSLSDAELLVSNDPNNNEAHFSLAQANFWIGYVHLERSELGDTLRHFQRYREIAQTLVDRQPDDERWLRELGYAHTNLGVLHKSSGEMGRALEQMQGAQIIAQTLVDRNPGDSQLLFDLGESTSWVGSALDALGDLDGALGQFRYEVAINQRVVEENPQNTTWNRGLSLAHRRLGEILEAQGKSDDALISYQSGLHIGEQLMLVEPNNVNWQRDVAVLRAGVGRIALALGDSQRALANFEIYTRTVKALLAQDSSKVRWQRDLAVSRIQTGNALMKIGELDAAGLIAAEAILILSKLQSEHPDDRLAIRHLSEAYLLKGRLEVLDNDEDAAREIWQRVLTLLETASSGTNDYRILNIQAQAFLHLDQVEAANPIIERLAKIGFADPTFVELCASRGLSARVLP